MNRRRCASDSGIGLEVHGSSPPGLVVLGDPLRLRQILINLVGNALRHAAASRIEARVEADASGLLLLVADNGKGVPLEAQARIFEPFNPGAGRGARGTGLGLAIVRRLAQIDTYRLECAVDVWPSSPRAADRDAGAWPTHTRAQA